MKLIFIYINNCNYDADDSFEYASVRKYFEC